MFIFNLFGPALKYRLDLFNHTSPTLSDHVLILTSKDSYKHYKEYHNKYEFVMIEDYRNEFELSKEYELLPDGFIDEIDHIKNMKPFYESRNTNYSFDIHRFIFPVMAERNIKNFCIVDSDTIFVNDVESVEKFFTNIPEGTLYAPFQGYDITGLESKKVLWQKVQKKYNFSEMDLTIMDGTGVHPYFLHDDLTPLFHKKVVGSINDGWCRGFHFRNTTDLKLFFNLWNSAIDELIINTYIEQQDMIAIDDKIIYQMRLDRNGMDHRTFWGLEWITSQINFLFSRELNYDANFHIAQLPGNLISPYSKSVIAKHRSRAEDNLFWGSYDKRGAWYDSNFDYSDTSSIKNFISNNKEELIKYYKQYGFEVDVTDGHVYTSIQ